MSQNGWLRRWGGVPSVAHLRWPECDHRSGTGAPGPASAAAEFIADIFLCPLEAARIRQVSGPTMAEWIVNPQLPGPPGRKGSPHKKERGALRAFNCEKKTRLSNFRLWLQFFSPKSDRIQTSKRVMKTSNLCAPRSLIPAFATCWGASQQVAGRKGSPQNCSTPGAKFSAR